MTSTQLRSRRILSTIGSCHYLRRRTSAAGVTQMSFKTRDTTNGVSPPPKVHNGPPLYTRLDPPTGRDSGAIPSRTWHGSGPQLCKGGPRFSLPAPDLTHPWYTGPEGFLRNSPVQSRTTTKTQLPAISAGNYIGRSLSKQVLSPR